MPSRLPCLSDILTGFLHSRHAVEHRGQKYHRGRLSQAIREEIETILEGELADPRIGLASVSSVIMAQDTRSARMKPTLSAPSKGWPLPRIMSGTNWRSGCGCDGLRSFIFRSIVPINWRVELTSFWGARKSVAGKVPSPAPKGQFSVPGSQFSVTATLRLPRTENWELRTREPRVKSISW